MWEKRRRKMASEKGKKERRKMAEEKIIKNVEIVLTKKYEWSEVE